MTNPNNYDDHTTPGSCERCGETVTICSKCEQTREVKAALKLMRFYQGNVCTIDAEDPGEVVIWISNQKKVPLAKAMAPTLLEAIEKLPEIT